MHGVLTRINELISSHDVATELIQYICDDVLARLSIISAFLVSVNRTKNGRGWSCELFTELKTKSEKVIEYYTDILRWCACYLLALFLTGM